MYGHAYLNHRRTQAVLSAIEHGYDVARLPGCIGAVDVMKVQWKKFPVHTKDNNTIPRMGNWRLLVLKRDAITSFMCGGGSAVSAVQTPTKLCLNSLPIFIDILSGRFINIYRNHTALCLRVRVGSSDISSRTASTVLGLFSFM